MKERPILFSAPMVRAILEGRKTQTRRVIKPAPGPRADEFDSETMNAAWQEGWISVKCPYGQPGDRLWVRESVLQSSSGTTLPSGEYESYWTREKVEYCADSPEPKPRYLKPDYYCSPYMLKRPSIHMPRWASRISLVIADVRVERLNDISEADAIQAMTLTFKTLRDANDSRQQEWDKGNVINLAYRGNELAGEVGEACNIIKKLERERLGIAGSRATVADLAQELADVIICADLIARDAGIDLGKAVAEKFNATSEKVGLATMIMLPGVDYLAEARAEQQQLQDADRFGAAVSDHYQVGVMLPLKALRGWKYDLVDGVMPEPNPEWEAKAKAFRDDIRAKYGSDVEPEATLTMLARWTSEALPANEHGQIPFPRALLESAEDALRFLLKESAGECEQCGATPVVANLDFENLCKSCADKWAQAEGQAAAEREAEGGEI